ncbi:hypothetical protein D770_18995 [Flammeovirgaceae bacterium 311]|nr:hypothetical protein D770_18995 [Flammeovirgaceae bacterium 311]
MLLLPGLGFSQNLTDGLMMSANSLCTGFMFSHDRWTHYWEGELKRNNENIGALTTQSLVWAGTYGLTDKINLIAMLPYIKTDASNGNMSGMEGLQDATLAVKYKIYEKGLGDGSFKSFAVVGASTPLSNYTPDYYPFSLGTGTTNLIWRLNAIFKLTRGFYTNISGGYTWRSNTKLDRAAYYTDGQMFMTNEVKMPNVADLAASLGYLNGGLQAEVFYLQQNTLGGGDIRRQDMPFVSNRMNFSKAGALLMYYLPMHKNLAVRASTSLTLAGRNIGESTTFMGGLFYTFHFSNKSE